MPSPSLDAIDRKIVRLLQQDARLTVQSIADRVGLSASPCARRIRLLERAGVIRAYVAIVDQATVGLPVSAFVSVKLTHQREEELTAFTQAVSSWPEVVDCFLMTGMRDYLMRVVVADLAAYESFLREKLTRLECVASIETSFALRSVKLGAILPL